MRNHGKVTADSALEARQYHGRAPVRREPTGAHASGTKSTTKRQSCHYCPQIEHLSARDLCSRLARRLVLLGRRRLVIERCTLKQLSQGVALSEPTDNEGK